MADRNSKATGTAPPLPSLVLTTLRRARGWTGQQLAEASGLSVQMISRYEAGRRPPSRERLESLAAVMGYGPEAIDLFLLALKGASEPAGLPASPVDPAPEELQRIRQLAGQAGLAPERDPGQPAAPRRERHRVSNLGSCGAALP